MKLLARVLSVFSLGAFAVAARPAIAAEAPPRLAVVISVDQMRADYLERFAPWYCEGGFRRFMQQGLMFTECRHEHAITKTGPGHATLLTGVEPCQHGIIENDWKQRQLSGLDAVNCVEDRAAPLLAPGLADKWRPAQGRSPRHLLADTVGDQLKLAHGAASKVYGLADKDRAAILMSGRRADAAYWMLEDGRFVTSTYYRSAPPPWLTRFNASHPISRYFGLVWDRLVSEQPYNQVQGPDDARGEATPAGLGRTFPRRVDGGEAAPSTGFAKAFNLVPWNNEHVAALARELIVQGNLGADDGAPDLLALGFSQPDAIGHAYGPDSHEVMDTYLRLDRTLAAFFDFLDERVGLKNCVIVLTSDHGCAPLPERVQLSSGKVSAGRLNDKKLLQAALTAMEQAYGPSPSGAWATRDGSGFHLNQAALLSRGVALAEAEKTLQAALEAVPAVASTYTRAQLTGSAPLDAAGEAMRLSYYPARSGDVMFVLKPYYIDAGGSGTTHGQPYDYDQHVPLLWLGAGVPAGKRDDRVGTQELASTLAPLLGIRPPSLAKGRRLF